MRQTSSRRVRGCVWRAILTAFYVSPWRVSKVYAARETALSTVLLPRHSLTCSLRCVVLHGADLCDDSGLLVARCPGLTLAYYRLALCLLAARGAHASRPAELLLDCAISLEGAENRHLRASVDLVLRILRYDVRSCCVRRVKS